LIEKRNKAQLAVEVARRTIDSLRIRAPFDGHVTIRRNFMAFGGIDFGGSMPDYRVGDATFAGQPVADVIDSSRVEVTAKLSGRTARTSLSVRGSLSAWTRRQTRRSPARCAR
jgi:hypothetical protein